MPPAQEPRCRVMAHLGHSTILGILSVSGPGAFAAMRESRGYLKDSYGPSSMEWSVSAKSASSGEGDYQVEYEYAGRTGSLHATWTGEESLFSEDSSQ